MDTTHGEASGPAGKGVRLLLVRPQDRPSRPQPVRQWRDTGYQDGSSSRTHSRKTSSANGPFPRGQPAAQRGAPLASGSVRVSRAVRRESSGHR